MPTERHDHFAAMRSEPEVIGEPPEGAPIVSPAIIEWLERQGFGASPELGGSFAGSLDGALAVSHAVAFCNGQRNVITHLQSLVRSA